MSLFSEYPDPGTCDHPKIEPARIIQANGASLVFLRCVDCDGPVQEKGQPGKWLPHDKVFGKVEDLPVWRDDRALVPPCQKCASLGAELHHIAPREVFGDECDEWPTCWLCRRCHGLWHVRMLRGILDGHFSGQAED